jgi:hypothetical protein
MNFTTQSLATQYDELVLLRQIKAIKASEFKTQVKKLVDKQKKNDERNRIAREKREAIREAERQREIARKLKEAEEKAKASREKAKAKALVKKQNAKVRSNVVMDKLVPDDVEKFVYRELWKGLSETYPSLLVYIVPEDKNDDETRLDVQYYKKYAEYRKQFGYDSLILNTGDRFIALTDTKISGERLQQAFRDGIQHCVFEPIKLKIKNAIESSKSKDASKKWILRSKRINELEKKYSKGVPEDKMGEVATASGYKIMIKDILGNDINVYNEKSQKGQIIFTNTRADHIDTGFMSLDEKGIELSQDDMIEKWDEVRSSNEFYMMQGDIKNKLPKKILTINGVWALQNDEKKYFDEMDAIVSVRDIQFNATAHPDVNEFIKAGRLINSWNCNLNDIEATGHIDMPKAYTQFKKCNSYAGFLGHIHQWRTGTFDSDFVVNNIGIYRFKVVSGGNEYFKRVGMIVGSEHILPSVEILFYIKNGLEVSIDAGVWGSRIDFDFTDAMLEKGEDNVPRYSRWAGKMASEHPTKSYTFKSDRKWASHLKHELGDNVFYWDDMKLCSVRVPNKFIYTTHHITAFITSYVRIQMMEAMMKFPIENLVRVVLDGLYFKGEVPSGLEWFREKEIKTCDFSDVWYLGNSVDVCWDSNIIKGNTLLTGQGGCGKSYKILNDKGLNKVLFVSPMNILGCKVSKEYGIRNTTIHKLLGKECVAWKEENAYPPVLLLDEISMIDAEWIDEVFKMYPKSLIILAGDINENGQWFQCRNGSPGNFSTIWKPVGVDIVNITGDRRSLDDELKALKINIRNKMIEVFEDGDSIEVYQMKEWALKNLKCIDFFDAVQMFKEGDAWIAGTHKTNEALLSLGVVSGYYKKGGNVSFEAKEGFEKRGSFTTHSYQGQTIEDKKVFISVNDMFEYSMLYTAISRVRRIEQLVFVR